MFEVAYIAAKYFANSGMIRESAVEFMKEIYLCIENAQKLLTVKYSGERSGYIHNTTSCSELTPMAQGQNKKSCASAVDHIQEFVKVLIVGLSAAQIHFSYKNSVADNRRLTTFGRPIRKKRGDTSTQQVVYDFNGTSVFEDGDEAQLEAHRLFPYVKKIEDNDKGRLRSHAIYAAVRQEHVDNIVPGSLKIVGSVEAKKDPRVLYHTTLKVHLYCICT